MGRKRKRVTVGVGTLPNMKTTNRFGRVVVLPKHRQDVPNSGSDSDEADPEKEAQRNATLEDYTNMIREKCVVTIMDRWILYDPQWDPSANEMASLIVEIDKTTEGELRMKRCIKIYGDRTYQVLVDNVDMTEKFEYINFSKKLETVYDSDKLIHALISKKVCEGLRTYDPKNPVLSQADLPIKQRGKLWYAKDCMVVVAKSSLGNSCNSCQKVRNQIRRALVNAARKKSRTTMKLQSTFGKALYSMLNDFSGRGPIPPSQYPRENLVFDNKLEIYVNFKLHQRLFIASTMPQSPPLRQKSRKRKNSKTSGRGRYPPPSSTITSEDYYRNIQQYLTEDGQLWDVSNVMDPNVGSGSQYGMQMLVDKFETPDMKEYVTLNDGSIIELQNLQQDEEFQMFEGQGYELAASAASINPMEIYPAGNQQIQIIEIDDATMEQIEVHNSTENMQIASVDPNDPNLSQLFRAFQSQIQGFAL